jgi:hypothetical protein
VTGIHPKTWEDGVMPLSDFPAEHRERIQAAIDRPKPPPRWITVPGAQMQSRAWWEWHWTRGLKLRRRVAEERTRKRIPDALRMAIYDRDGWACLHCGETESLSLDHIHPHSLGGEDTLDNLQTLCRPCNSRKGTRTDAS